MLKNLLRYGMAGLMALAMFLSILPGRALAANTRFGDMAEGATFYNEVTAAASLGLVGGYEDGTFRPGNGLTNGAFVKMVASAFTQIGGYPAPTVAQVGAFASSIAFVRERAEKLGKASPELSTILDNTSAPATRYNAIVVLDAVTPDKEYSTGSSFTILGGYFAPPFSDADSNLMSMIDCVNGGMNSRVVIGGFPDNTVRAESQLTRGQGVALVMRYTQLRLLDAVSADWQQKTVLPSEFNCTKGTPSAITSLLIAGLEAGWQYNGCSPYFYDPELGEQIIEKHPHVMAIDMSRGGNEFLGVWMDGGEYAVYSYEHWATMYQRDVEVVGESTNYDALRELIEGGNVTIQPAPDPVKIQPAPSDPSISPVNPGVPEEREETTEITTTGGYSESWLRNRLNNSSWSDSDVPEMLAYYMVSVGFTDVTITKNVGGDYDGQRRISGEGGVILTIYVYDGTGSSYRAAGHGIIGVTAMTDHPTVADAVSEIDAVSGRVHILPHEPDMTIQPAPENTIDTTVTTAVPTAAHQGFMLGMAA